MRLKRVKRAVLGLAVLVGLSVGQTYGGSLVPTEAPGATMHTVEEIYQQVATIEGNLANQALSPATAVVAAGRYAVTNLTQVDTDLVTGNIRSGVNIFGVTGKTEVVDTTTGDAVAADILTGKKAWVDGSEVTGTASISAAPAPVARTGQTATVPENPAVAGSDGALQKGVPWPNPRFTDNSDGTVTDNLTGLIWLKNANAFGQKTWATALTDCSTLNSGEHGLTDGSIEGDWRLPHVEELHSLKDWRYYNPAVPNTAGIGQWTAGDPFTGVQSSTYWSSTTFAASTTRAWYVSLYYGFVNIAVKGYTYYVWPVRGGE